MKLDIYLLNLEWFLRIKEMLLTAVLKSTKLNQNTAPPEKKTQTLFYFNGIFMSYIFVSGLPLTFSEL